MVHSYRIIASVLALVLLMLSGKLVKYYAIKIRDKYDLTKERYYMIRCKVNILINFLLIITLILIWGIDIKDLWIAISGLLALIAVAFFAIWSLIGNILAGVLLFFTNPFKIGDNIEIHPDNIKGKVLTINTFFTLIEESEGIHISVPNSIFFQKYIKRQRKISDIAPQSSSDKVAN